MSNFSYYLIRDGNNLPKQFSSLLSLEWQLLEDNLCFNSIVITHLDSNLALEVTDFDEWELIKKGLLDKTGAV